MFVDSWDGPMPTSNCADQSEDFSDFRLLDSSGLLLSGEGKDGSWRGRPNSGR